MSFKTIPRLLHIPMRWAKWLKRASKIDIEVCERCGGKIKIIACIEDPLVIEKILGHLRGEQDQQKILPSAQVDWLQHERALPFTHWPGLIERSNVCHNPIAGGARAVSGEVINSLILMHEIDQPFRSIGNQWLPG